MRTHLYKFIFIVISLCALATTNAWANKIVYLDVTDAPFHSDLEYTTDMYIYYWVPGSDTKKYYQLVPKNDYQMVKGRMVYRIVLGNNANTSDEWWWRVCRKNTGGDGKYYHYHKEIRYNEYNWYRIQNKMWVYDERNDSTTSSKHKDGIAYRTPGLLTGGHIYFDNARTKWTGVVQFVVGHGSEMHTYTLTKIDDTELYYLNLTEALKTRGDNWGISHTYYSFIANTSAWEDTKSLHPEGVKTSDIGFSENYRRQGELLDGKVYFIRPKQESGNWLFDIYQTVPKYTIYQRAMIRPTGGSYAAVANGVNYPASVNISLIDTIYGSTQETVSKTYNSGTNKNYNPRVLIAGEITHTCTDLKSDAYTFDGWGSEPSTTGVPTLTAPSTANAGLTHYISENTTVCAFFTAKQFTVTLNNQNATTAGTTSVTPSYGYAMPKITPPTRTGYTFGGYYTATNGGGTQYYKADGTSAKNYDLTSTLTLYAKWTANKYKVKFNGNGHTSGSMADQSFTYDVAQNLTANAFSRTGYTFSGWNTNADGTGTSYTNQQSVKNLNATNDGQITLYAQWTANKYTITLNANGGSGNTASVQATYASATLTPAITPPARTGYTFKGWYSADNGGTLVINTDGQLQASISGFTDANKKWNATTDKILYAQWTANVNCRQYVFTTVDHLGRAISTTENFANDIIANAPNAPEPDPCSTSYTFAGWSMTEVAYGSPSFTPVTFPFVMPAEDITLYPVYICNSDYHRVTSDLGANNWAGDYLIAYSDHIFADGRFGGTGDAAIGKANVQAEDFSTAIVNDVVPADPYGKRYHVTLESVEGGYVLKTQDGRYNYIRNTETSGLVDASGKNTAATYPLTISFDEKSHNVSIANLQTTNKAELRYTGSRFGFYSPDSYYPIYLYKKYLYTSSLICEEITAEDAMVTSTADQTIKVNVTATMSNMTVDRERELTVKSDNSDFDATIVPTTNANEYNVAVCYTPKDNTDGTETANITIKVNNNPVTTFQVTGRHLPANFVIAAKWGDNWYALPANIDGESSKEGLLIEVDNPADPTKAIAAPNNTQYSLRSVKPGKFANQGERLVFVGSAGKTLYNAEGTSIQVYAQYENYDDDRYEWIPTTDLKDYTLTSAHVYTDEEPRTISLDNYGVFGTLLQNKSYNGQVRLLPVDNFYEPIELQIVEWKQNSVSVMYKGAGTHYITQVGESIASGVLSESKIDHAVYRLSTTDLTTATNQPLTITIKDGETIIGAITITIPAIVVGEKNSTSLVTNNDIAKATSVVVLDGATLTADATKYTYDDIVVYPGGKLVINDGTKLGMYTLTFRLGSSWGATEYEHKYPEFVLNTTADGAYTNTSGKINLDYVTTKAQYYTFVAPFAVNTKDIKYPVDIYGSNVKPDNTGSFEFQYYDGAARADGRTGWTVVPEGDDGADLEAGQGYTFLGMPKKINGTRQKYGIHRIPMSISAEDAMLHETREQTVSIAAHPALKNNNSGWNLIGNPYMQLVKGIDNNAIQVGNLVKIMNANGTWTGGWHWDDEDPVTAERYLVFPSNDGLSYTAVQTQNAELPAFKNFFVQINNEAGTEMTIPNPNQQVQPALQAPAYHDGEAIETDVEVAMVLEQDEKHTDQLDLLINKAYTADFDRDADFTKMMNATQLNLFGVHWDNLSFIAIDQQNAQQSIPIGYQVPDAGEYTLRMSDKPYLMWDKIEALYLTDHEMEPEVTTDIMQQPYLFHVGKAETNHTRFTLSIIRKAESENQTPTHIDTQVAERKWSCKFIYQNKIYILHDGVIYDMMGKQIRTINK